MLNFELSPRAQVLANLFTGTSNQFASITYTCDVAGVAAKHKKAGTVVQKRVTCQAQVYTTFNAYKTAVENSVSKLSGDKPEFTPQRANYEHHSEFFHLGYTASTGKQKLIYRSLKTDTPQYFVNGEPATKAQVAEYLTKSAKEKLLNPPSTVENKTEGFEHKVFLRTLDVENLERVAGNGQVITFD